MEISKNIQEKFTALLDAIGAEKESIVGFEPDRDRRTVFNFDLPKELLQFVKQYGYEKENFNFVRLAGFTDNFVQLLFRDAYARIYPVLADLFKNKTAYIKCEDFFNARYKKTNLVRNGWDDKIMLHISSGDHHIVIRSKTANTAFRFDLYDVIPHKDPDSTKPTKYRFREKIADFYLAGFDFRSNNSDMNLAIGEIFGCMEHYFKVFNEQI